MNNNLSLTVCACCCCCFQESNVQPLLDAIDEAKNKVEAEREKTGGAQLKDLAAACAAANKRVSELSAEAKAAEDALAAERTKLELLERELDELRRQHSDVFDQLEETRSRAVRAAKKLASQLSDLESRKQKLYVSIASLSEQESLLAESSKLPPEVLATLEKLDRRALSEITRMSSPPAIIKASLEIVYIFLEVFPPKNKSEEGASLAGDLRAPSASGSASSSPSKTPSKSVRNQNSNTVSASSSSPSKTPSKSVRNQNSNARGGSVDRRGGSVSRKSQQRQPNELPPPKEWAGIRKLLAVDLRPRLLAITPDLVATKENEPLVLALQTPMSKLHAAEIERASKPAGLLWVWCNALVLCDESIKTNRVVTAELKQQQVVQSVFFLIAADIMS
jgi:hypothetical protein